MTAFQQFAEAHQQLVQTEHNCERYYSLETSELLDEFVHWMRYSGNYGERTITAKRRKVRKFFRETGLGLQDVTLQQLKLYKAFLLEKVKNDEHSKNYVSVILTDLNVFFCHFLGRKDLRVPSIEKEEISFERLTRADIDAMVTEIENRTDTPLKKQKLHKAIILTLWNELPRVSELCNLKLGDIRELSRKVLFESRKRSHVPAHLRHPFATQEFLAVWKEYKQYRDSDNWDEDAPAFVQVNKKGRPIGPKFVRRMLKDYAARAGIEKRVTPHIIRKSGGTELSMKNPKLGQIQLGHKNIKTTLTHYTGPNQQDKQHIDTILNPNRSITPRDIAEELSRKYITGQIPEKEYIYAIKNLRQSHTHNHRTDDPAIQ